MIRFLKYLISNQFNPYYNLALEEYLLNHINDGECILYLWQNEKTVVIGRNQNPWKECRLKELEEDGGKMIRRLSGGGAVYHDLGNLNFTFLLNNKDYDLNKQLKVIIEALSSMGIPVSAAGRNDITAEGKKISGNAFYSDKFHSYHHGTLLLHVDMEALGRYLKVSHTKLALKGVDSVKSRVANLKDYNDRITAENTKAALISAFSQIYGSEAKRIFPAAPDNPELLTLIERYFSWDWNFGKKIDFNYSFETRFIWGDIHILLQVEAGCIKECMAYSDAMEISFIRQIPDVLKNSLFRRDTMIDKLKQMGHMDAVTKVMLEDIITLMEADVVF